MNESTTFELEGHTANLLNLFSCSLRLHTETMCFSDRCGIERDYFKHIIWNLTAMH